MSAAATATTTPAPVPALDAAAIRAQFPVLSRQVHGKPLVYLDNAATTLKPQAVIERLHRHYAAETANIHRGVHYLSEQATAAYEQTRERVRTFLGAAEPEEIIFTSGTTDSINQVALAWGGANLGRGDEVVITWMEHHSNIVPWQMLAERTGAVLRVAPISDRGELEWEALLKLLGPRTKLLAAVHVSNSLGTINPAAELVRAGHAVGARVLLDGAQAAAHLPVDVRALDVDFYCCSGHKLFGPTGTGVLYGKRELLEAMPPVRGGGEMIKSVTFAKTTYNDLPNRLEPGTPHIAGVIGLGAALEWISNVGLESIRRHEERLLTEATAALRAIDGVRIIGNAACKSAILSFTVGDVHAHDVGTIADREGVALRTGHHCTQPVMERFGVPATARAAFSVYNDSSDVAALARAVGAVSEVFG